MEKSTTYSIRRKLRFVYILNVKNYRYKTDDSSGFEIISKAFLLKHEWSYAIL